MVKESQKSSRTVSWFVYILRCRDNSLYTGCTNNLARRLRQHQRGSGCKYTAPRIPVELVWFTNAASRSEAMKVEAFIKTIGRENKLKLISGELEWTSLRQHMKS